MTNIEKKTESANKVLLEAVDISLAAYLTKTGNSFEEACERYKTISDDDKKNIAESFYTILDNFFKSPTEENTDAETSLPRID